MASFKALYIALSDGILLIVLHDAFTPSLLPSELFSFISFSLFCVE